MTDLTCTIESGLGVGIAYASFWAGMTIVAVTWMVLHYRNRG